MQIKDLKANKKNPRKISGKKLAALKASVEKFGDLGCIVMNRETSSLIAGHQRVKALPPNTRIVIEKKYDQPTAQRTVAEGYIDFNGERFKYREVEADPTWEAEAMLAANKHGGEWDSEVLRVLLADTPNIDISLTGFDIEELTKLNVDVKINLPAPQVNSEVTQNEYEHTQNEYAGSDEDEDAQYIADNPGPDSSLGKENIDMVNRTKAFEETEENTKPMGRRIVLIIDCATDEMKASIKEKTKEIVEKEGGKFF